MPYLINPEGLAPAQMTGEACVSCAKSWPAPNVPIGRLPGGGTVRCCPECARAVVLYRPEPAAVNT
jgi:hypothetical protein